MRTGTKAGIKYAVPNLRVWSAERQIINLERVSGSVSEVKLKKRRQGVTPFTYDELATYKIDSSGKCAIDITELVRVYGVYQSDNIRNSRGNYRVASHKLDRASYTA